MSRLLVEYAAAIGGTLVNGFSACSSCRTFDHRRQRAEGFVMAQLHVGGNRPLISTAHKFPLLQFRRGFPRTVLCPLASRHHT